MNIDFAWSTEAGFALGSASVALAAVLVLAAWVLLPAQTRGKARLPTLLLVLHFSLLTTHKLVPGLRDVRRGIEVAALFVLLACLGRTCFLLVVEWLLGHRLKRPLPRIIGDIVQALIYFGVGFVTFREAGVALGSLLATSALLTAVIGLSLQETLGNLFAGLAIQIQRPFQIGDWIQVEGTPDSAIGRVIEINWRATKILTNDEVEIIFPNGLLAKSAIRNYTEPTPISRRIVSVQGPYALPPHQMETALIEAARGCPGVVADPAPTTWVSQFTDRGIEYALVYFIDDFERRPVIDAAVRRRLWYALKRAGISVPLPARDVRLHETAESPERQRDLEISREQQREQMLRTVDFLKVLPEQAVAQLARASTVRPYSAGEDIIRQGDEGTDLFILQSGAAAVLVGQEGAQPVGIARLGPGGVFGEMSLATGERRSATVRALGPCELIVVGHAPFREVLEQNPELAQRISEVLASRQAEIDQARSALGVDYRAASSSALLSKILRFFSLQPRGKGSTPERG
jgi:small-conductance mechanosensitive channel/CRP-like cAMP-binding protein